jgi:NAD(P)H-hydrate epimerase
MQPATQAVSVVHEVPQLAPRAPDSHKGSYGRVLVVAGSRGMSGAAVLCASAALRGGAGLVRLATAQEMLPVVAAGNPCYTTIPLPQDDQGRVSGAALPNLIELVRDHSACAIGPGLNRTADSPGMLRSLLEDTTTPLVLDADALNALAGRLGSLGPRAATLVLTPHPGEFGRLIGSDTAAVQANRRDLAVRFAQEHGVVLVLKGHRTLVTDGRHLYVNTTGNPGMATGGSGDVLTGLTAALLGQGLEPFAAARLGVYVHGLAGDLARAQVGEVGLIATDLLNYLPAAFLAHAGQH